MVSVLGLLLALTTGVASAPPPATAGVQAKLHAVLQRYLAERGKIERITAASVAVNYGNGKPIVTEAVGATPSSLFQIGSNTKAFTSTLVLEMEAAGKLSIDEPIGRWLSQYPAWKNVTLRHLLDMTSGIPTYDNEQAFQRAYSASPHHYFTPQELIRYVYPPNGKPQVLKGWNYSNTGYLLAQLILEKVTGQSYGDLLRSRIFTPLGLHDTFYDVHALPPAAQSRLVSGYFFSNDPDNAGFKPIYNTDVKNYTLSWTQAAGGIVSTPNDVTRWARTLYSGTLLPKKQVAEMKTIVSMDTGKRISQPTAAEPRGFGLGVGEMYFPGMGRIWFYEGETLGYRVTNVQLPNGIVISVGLNSQPNAKQDHIGDLMNQIFAALKLK